MRFVPFSFHALSPECLQFRYPKDINQWVFDSCYQASFSLMVSDTFRRFKLTEARRILFVSLPPSHSRFLLPRYLDREATACSTGKGGAEEEAGRVRPREKDLHAQGRRAPRPYG